MKLQIIVIHDSAADVYGQPQFVASIGGAIRSFGDAVNAKDKPDALSQHPEDFVMYHVGEYEDASCDFAIFDKPRQLVRGADVKK